jgi:hypothetical protein
MTHNVIRVGSLAFLVDDDCRIVNLALWTDGKWQTPDAHQRIQRNRVEQARRYRARRRA